MRVLRKRNRTKAQNRPTVPLAPELGLVIRRNGVLGSGVHARYPLGVAERKINRGAWARLVAALVESETRGKKATFARLVGVDPRTISRWLNSEVDVSEESVREVARGLHLSPIELLIRVGYYSPNELSILPPPAPPAEVDEVIDLILAAEGFTNEEKMNMILRIQDEREAQRAHERQRELNQVRWWMEQRKGA